MRPVFPSLQRIQQPRWSARDGALLAAILAVAAAVRLWGSGFGLPNTYCRPDEMTVVNIALRFGTGDLNPEFFAFPTLFMYFLTGCYGLYFVVGLLAGHFHGPSDLVASYIADPSVFYWIPRGANALLGTATVYVAYRIAGLLWGRKTGLLAALFMALMYLPVREAHFGVTDTPLVLFCLTSVLFTLQFVQGERLHDLVLAAAMGGAAMSTKYNGALVAIPMCVACLLAAWNGPLPGRWKRLIGRLALFGLVLAVAFLVGTPYALVTPRVFVADVLREARHQLHGHAGLIVSIGWLWHARFSLWYGLGWTMFLAGLAGMAWVPIRDGRRGLVLCVLPLVWYLCMGKSYVVFARYMLVLVPFFCFGAARLLMLSSAWVTVRGGSRWGSCFLSLSVLLLLFPSVQSVFYLDRSLAREDTRVLAARWVTENVPRGASLCEVGTPWDSIRMCAPMERAAKVKSKTRHSASTPNQEAGDRPDRPATEACAYVFCTYNSKAALFRTADYRTSPPPSYIIVAKGPVAWYRELGRFPEVEALASQQYELAQSFVGYADEANNRYDPQDAFFLPFAGFAGVKRPGPNIRIYRQRTANSSDPGER